MNLEIVITILLAYIAVGIANCNLGPLARKSKGEDLMLATSARSPQAVSQSHTLLFLWTVLLWPVVLVQHFLQPHPDLEHIGATGSAVHANGLTYARMKGVGTLICGDCGKNYEVLSYTQADGWSAGYQCQRCGRFETRSYKEPFARPNPNYFNVKTPLAELHPVYRQHRIEHVQSLIRIIENGMQTTPRTGWMKTWEPDLAKYREELGPVSQEELAQVKKLRQDADAAFEASLNCECGGTLDREKVLFCPACKSRSLSYTTQHIA